MDRVTVKDGEYNAVACDSAGNTVYLNSDLEKVERYAAKHNLVVDLLESDLDLAFYGEIREQQRKLDGPTDLDMPRWLSLIVEQVGTAAADVNCDAAGLFRESLIKIAAAAVQAIGSLDRQEASQRAKDRAAWRRHLAGAQDA